MIKLGNNLSFEVCRVLLLTPSKELKKMFNKDDAKIFHKVANKIENAHRSERKEDDRKGS